MESEIKINKTQKTNFTQVPNEILNDENLSWGAKGLWAYMAGKPAGWKFTLRLMCSQTKEGLDATTSKLDELLKAGYVKRKIVMTKNGKRCFYSIFDEPSSTLPSLEKPSLENPSLEYSNKDISNKEISKKEIRKKEINKEKSKKNKFVRPTVEDVKAYCEEKGYDIDAEYFFEYYESVNWRNKNGPIKSWKQTLVTWNRNQLKWGKEKEKNSAEREKKRKTLDFS